MATITDYSQLKWAGKPLAELTDEQVEDALGKALTISGALWQERQRRLHPPQPKKETQA